MKSGRAGIFAVVLVVIGAVVAGIFLLRPGGPGAVSLDREDTRGSLETGTPSDVPASTAQDRTHSPATEKTAESTGLDMAPRAGEVARAAEDRASGSEEADDGRVTGRVVDPEGNPVPDVLVRPSAGGLSRIVLDVLDTATTAAPVGVRTGEDGVFRIDLGVDRSYALEFVHNDFATQRRGAVRGRPGEEVSLEDIELRLGGAVSGRVVDEAGLPLAGVELHLVRADNPWSEINPADFAEEPDGVTAADGSYALSHVTPGMVRVAAVAEGHARASSEARKVVQGKTAENVTITMQDGVRISGRVLSAAGSPVSGARVQAFEANRDEVSMRVRESLGLGGHGGGVLTDAEGRFEIVDLAAGTYDLVARADGLARTRVEEVLGGTGDLIVRMGDCGSIRGVVRSRSTGEPLDAFDVSLRYGGKDVPLMINIGGGRDLIGPEHVSNSSGSFLLDGIEPGTYTLAIRASGYAENEEKTIRVAAGEIAEAGDIRLAAGGRLEGVVLTAKGERPIAGARVRAKLDRGEDQGALRGFIVSGGAGRSIDLAGKAIHAETDADGRFRIDSLAAGSYDVAVTHPGFVADERAEIEVDPLTEPAMLRFEMRTGGGITGTAFDPDGYPAPGATVEVRDESGFFESASTDGYGNFFLGSLAPGAYFAKLAEGGAAGGMMVASAVMVTMGDGGGEEREPALPKMEVEGTPVEVSEGEVARVDLFERRKGRITGVVREGGEVREGARVMLEKSGGMFAMPQNTIADSDGEYEFADLAPASYRVVVRADGEQREIFGRTVEIDEGDDVEIDVELPTGFIEGRVVTLQGNQPIEGASVRIEEDDPTRFGSVQLRIGAERGIHTDAEGRYRVPSVAAGTYRVSVSRAGFAGESVAGVEVAEGEGKGGVDLKLSEGGSVRGVVRSEADGSPLPFAFVQLAEVGGGPVPGTEPAISSEDGGYSLPGVEAGNYDLIVGHMGHEQKRVNCRVRKGETAEIDVRLVPKSGGG